MLVTCNTQITVLIKAWQTGIILEIRMASSSNVTGPTCLLTYLQEAR